MTDPAITTIRVNYPLTIAGGSSPVISIGTAGAAGTYTAGSVIFAKVPNVFGQDNANFFWDVSSHSLGIGDSPVARNAQLYLGGIASGSMGVSLLTTFNPAAAASSYGVSIFPLFNKASSGTHADFASVLVTAPDINAGASTLTNATSLKITGAPTVGDNRRALWVADGLSQLAAATTAAASLRLPHGTAPSIPVDGDAWTATTGIYSQINSATINLSHFTQQGANAVVRIFQTKGRDIWSVPDSGTIANAITDYVSAFTSGSIFVPAGSVTLSTFNESMRSSGSLTFDYAGPEWSYPGYNGYRDAGAGSTWSPDSGIATRAFISSRGTHTGDSLERSTVSVISWPTGAGVNPVVNTDYALNVNTAKQNWTTTTVKGQVSGINVVVRGGYHGTPSGDFMDGDTSAFISNIVLSSPSEAAGDFAASWESTCNFKIGNAAISQGIRTQIGVINGRNANYIGFLANAEVGTSTNAFQAQNTLGTGAWTNFFHGITDNKVRFDISSAALMKFWDDNGTKYVGFKPPATVTTSVDYTLPVNDGSSGFALITNGSGVLSWAAIVANSIVVGTTTVTGGTSGRVLAITAGPTLSEMTTTGSGTVLALATSPSFTTPVLGTPTSGNLANCTGYPVPTLAAVDGTAIKYTGTSTGSTISGYITVQRADGVGGTMIIPTYNA